MLHRRSRRHPLPSSNHCDGQVNASPPTLPSSTTIEQPLRRTDELDKFYPIRLSVASPCFAVDTGEIGGENGGKILLYSIVSCGKLRSWEWLRASRARDNNRQPVVSLHSAHFMYLDARVVAVAYCHELCVLPIACHLANQYQFHLTKTGLFQM